jgi:hypothetical protein
MMPHAFFSTWPDGKVRSSQLIEHRGIASVACRFIGAKLKRIFSFFSCFSCFFSDFWRTPPQNLRKPFSSHFRGLKSVTLKGVLLRLTLGWKLTSGRLPQVRGKTEFGLHNSAICESISTCDMSKWRARCWPGINWRAACPFSYSPELPSDWKPDFRRSEPHTYQDELESIFSITHNVVLLELVTFRAQTRASLPCLLILLSWLPVTLCYWHSACQGKTGIELVDRLMEFGP